MGTIVGSVFSLVIDPYWLDISALIFFFAVGSNLFISALFSEEDNEGYEDKIDEVKTEFKLTKAKRETNTLAESVKIISSIMVAEMGDRSQLTAVALAAKYDFWTITLGGAFGHIVSIALAISFGKFISSILSERKVDLIGGLLFIMFSIYETYLLLF